MVINILKSLTLCCSVIFAVQGLTILSRGSGAVTLIGFVLFVAITAFMKWALTHYNQQSKPLIGIFIILFCLGLLTAHLDVLHYLLFRGA
ncbi:MAG: hypothetical protein F6J86_20710 [Symploca sp. SIO1B1]|nr:hypothetical protein [Symploca sp. SIO1B1]